MSRQSPKDQVRQLQHELERCRTNCRNHWAGKIVTWVGRIGLAGVITYGAFHTVNGLAGKTTQANIQLSATGSVSASANHAGSSSSTASTQSSSTEMPKADKFFLPGWLNFFSLSFGVGGMLFGFYQARLRRDYIQLFAPFQAELERRIDPDRSSSLLTDRGHTRQEDV